MPTQMKIHTRHICYDDAETNSSGDDDRRAVVRIFIGEGTGQYMDVYTPVARTSEAIAKKVMKLWNSAERV